jgi:hypothetical protein
VGLEFLNQDLIPKLRINEQYPSSVKTYEFETSANHSMEYTVGVPDLILPPPDIITNQEIIRIEWAQVNISSVWTPMRQLTPDDYYRMNQATQVSVIPQGFIFNRTHDPYDRFILTQPSIGNYKVRLACNGIVPEYNLDDEILLPSGYYACLKYGVAELLCMAQGMNDNGQRMNLKFKECMSLLASVNTSIPPKLRLDLGWQIHSIVVDRTINSNGGI